MPEPDYETPLHEQPESCEYCDWETADLIWINWTVPPAAGYRAGWLCRVCVNTPAGNAFCFPRQHDAHDILKAMSLTTNMVLAAITQAKGEA